MPWLAAPPSDLGERRRMLGGLARELEIRRRFVEGYVMLSYYTNQIDPALLSLDVTAAYSYSGQKADTGASVQVVRIEPRAMFQPE